MKNALVNADTSGSCVEVTDMLYKNVVVKLSKLRDFLMTMNLENR